MIALAIRTGISPDEWIRAGGRAIFTAFELLNEQDKADRGSSSDDDAGPVMSG